MHQKAQTRRRRLRLHRSIAEDLDELWAVARYDLGLSDDEFGELTPAMFQALCNRRNVRIKYERFANAQTAAAVYNVNRVKADDPIISAMDFVRDEESSRKKERWMLLSVTARKCFQMCQQLHRWKRSWRFAARLSRIWKRQGMRMPTTSSTSVGRA